MIQYPVGPNHMRKRTFFRILSSLLMTVITSSLWVASAESPVRTGSSTTAVPGQSTARYASSNGSVGGLYPVSPAHLPDTSNGENVSELPTVVVPFTAGYEVSKPPSPPKHILAPVPKSVVSKLAAYYITLGPDETMYIVAPRGLTGTMLIAGNGSARITLRGSHMELDFAHAGGSPFDIWSIAVPFYASARKALAQQLPGDNPVALRKATVSYQYHRRVAMFAFTDAKNRYVCGYTLYIPSEQLPTGLFSWGAQFLVASDKSDKSLVRWIMASAVNNLITIGDPFLVNHAIPSVKSTIAVGKKHVVLTVPTTYAGDTRLLAVTNRGTIWIGLPTMVRPANIAEAAPIQSIPNGDWLINLSKPGVNNLARGGPATVLAEVGAVKWGGAGIDPIYVYPALLSNQIPDWVLYTTTDAGLGNAQAYSNDLYAINLVNGKQIHLTTFTDAGGTFFSLGNRGDIVVYDQSGYGGAKGLTLVHDIWEVNLHTGLRQAIPVTQLVGNSVRLRVGGHWVSVPLHDVFH